MKTKLSKSQAQEKITDFFNKETFKPEEVKKLKRLAMKFNIKLKDHRKQFCKSCLSQLKGKLKVTKTHRTIICSKCNHKNKFKL